MIDDIIKISSRTSNNSNNYWKIYEDSYKDNDQLKTFIKSNIFVNKKNIDDICNDIEKIYDVRYSFYKKKSNYVLSYLIFSYYNNFLKDNVNIINDSISDFFKNGEINNFLKIYLKSCIDSDCRILNKFTFEINLILENVKNENSFIKFQYYLNKLFKIVDKIDRDKYLKSNIIKNISFSYVDKLIEFIDKNGLTYLSNLYKQPIFLNLFKEEVHISYFYQSVMRTFNKNLIFKIINFKYDSLTNSNYAFEIINIIKIINQSNKILDIGEINIENSENLNKFTNYICASLYYFLNDKNINNVYDIIELYFYNLQNKVDFLTFYKFHLQWRATHKLNFYFENEAFELIKKLFVDSNYKKLLDNIKNSLDDIYLSEHMNEEIRNLKITIETPEFKNVKFNNDKVNVFISSNVIWSDLKKSNNYEKIYKSKEIELYSKLVTNYYDKKYTCSDQKKRLLEISYDESFVDLSLGNSNIRLPITYLSVLEIIGNNFDIDFDTILRESNIDLDKLNIIINDFKVLNIIIEKNNKFYFNNNFLDSKSDINMMQNLNSVNFNIIDEVIEYDKDMMIDSVLVKVCKNKYINTENQNVSYGRLIMEVRNELNRFFIPDEKNIKNRLNRLETLGYLLKDKNLNSFKYVP